MSERPEMAWLYTRGPQSVRLVREENVNGCRLCVYGPETAVVSYSFADVTECMKRRQSEIEFDLLAAGYQLAQLSSERRSQHGKWRGPERRRGRNDRGSGEPAGRASEHRWIS